MLKLTKNIKKAFTLAEIFITMVVLSVLVSVCISFFSTNQKDVEREYFYYSAYQNIVRVVDAALMNEGYRESVSVKTVRSNCGAVQCVIFKNTQGTLCDIFVDYFNNVDNKCSVSNSSPYNDGKNSSITLTNGMQFFFSSQTPGKIEDLYVASGVDKNDYMGWTFWVDINGYGNGKDIKHYDIMKFYVTLSGKVIPAYGEVLGIRSYESFSLDAGGNPALMSFDVVYTKKNENVLTVVSDETRHTDFRTAACKSGYINDTVPYCKGDSDYDAISKDSTKCSESWAQCQIRLVQKLKRVR